MIITVTVNPAVDQTLWIDRLELGRVQRPTETQLDPAGKGINVSRMVHRLGWPTVAFGFLGGEVGRIVERALDGERVQHHFVPIAGQTRINVTIDERGPGRATSLFAPGPTVGGEEIAQLDELLGFWMPASRVVVLAGSLLPGMPSDYYARLVTQARSHGVKTIIDADGEAARLAADAAPFLIKPNVIEAERLLGRPLPDLPAIVAGAHELVRRGVEVVIVSMGPDGAICAARHAAWHVRSPQVERLSTVGSGDSLVAGLAVALARGDGLEAGLRLGTAAGAATAMSPGTALGTAQEVTHLLSAVRIESI